MRKFFEVFKALLGGCVGNILNVRGAETRLCRWGDWARANDIRLSAAGTLGRLQGGCGLRNDLPTDADAEEIDALICRLRQRNERMALALKLYFFRKMTYRDIGVYMNSNKDKAQSLVSMGVAWIDGALILNDTKIKFA